MPAPSQVLLVDGTAYLFRCYFAVPPRSAPDGTPVHAVAGLARLLLGLLRRVRPSHVAIAFDPGRKTFRHQLYPEYKADRESPPDDLKVQFGLAPEVCRALGFAVSVEPGFEADDVLATLGRRAERAGWRVVIVTADKDLAQLVTDRVSLYECVKDEHTRPDDVVRRFGVRADQLADLLAMAGDSTDHFPGLRGVGKTTAARLLRHADSLDALLADPELALHANIRNAKAIAKRLAEDVEEVKLFRRLSTLHDDVPTLLTSADLRWHGADRPASAELFDRLGLPEILDAVPRWRDATAPALPPVGRPHPAGPTSIPAARAAATIRSHLTASPSKPHLGEAP